MIELELATFDQIIEELAKRYGTMGCIVARPLDGEAGKNQRYRFAGDPDALLGLLVTLQYAVLREKEADTSDMEGE